MLLRSAIVVMLVVAGTAQAQAPEVRLDLSLPTPPSQVANGTTHSFQASIDLEVANVTCPMDSTLNLELAVVVTGGADVTAEGPAPWTVAIPQGVYLQSGGAGSAFETSSDATVNVTVAPTSQGGNRTVNVTATFPSQSPTDCYASAALPAASAAADYLVVVPAPPAPEPQPTQGGPANNTTAGDGGGSPGVAPLAVLVAAGLGFLARRRRDA